MDSICERLSITLPFDMAGMIRESVESGKYASNSEVIRDALRLWQDKQSEREKEILWLRKQLEDGRNSGDPIDAYFVFDELKNKYKAMIEEREN